MIRFQLLFVLCVSLLFLPCAPIRAIDSDKAGKKEEPVGIVVAYSDVGKRCEAALLEAAANLVAGPAASVAFTQFDNLAQGMFLMGLPDWQAGATRRAFKELFAHPQAPKVLKQVAAGVMAAQSNDDLLGICVLDQECAFRVRAQTFHISAGHPFLIEAFFGGKETPTVTWDRVSSEPVDLGDSILQAIVLQFLPQKSPTDMSTLIVNVTSFMHDAGYFDAMTRLSDWAKHIQQGGIPHPRIAKYITKDGRSIDVGFIRLVMESRAARAEVESYEVLFRLIQVPEEKLAALMKVTSEPMFTGAISKIREYGVSAQTALNDFSVAPEKISGLAEELIELIDWRG